MLGKRLYRPAAFLRFQIRFEDFGAAVDPEALSDDKAFRSLVIKAQTDHAAQLAVLARLRAAGDVAGTIAASRAVQKSGKAVLLGKSRAAEAAPQSREAGDLFSATIMTAPLDMMVEVNSASSFDKLTASFPFRDAPLYSQLIRSALVEGYLGTVPVEDFGYPDRWRLPLQRAQIMFRGYVDDWDTDHDDEDAKVSICARSMEALLHDGKINPWAKDYRINGDGEPISVYVNRILGLFPPTSGKTGGDRMQAMYYPGNVSRGTPADAQALAREPILDRKRLNRTLQSAQSRNQAAGGAPGAPNAPIAEAPEAGTGPGERPGTGNPAVPSTAPMQEMTVWQLIERACRLAGVIPVYDPSLLLPVDKGGPGDLLLLRPPHTTYAKVDGGTAIEGGSDELPPFARSFVNDDTGQAVPSEVRLMVWGQNIKAFKTNRKLGRIRAPAVEVISFNRDAPPAERVKVIRYPPGDKVAPGDRTKKVKGSGGATRGTSIGQKGQWAVDHVQTINIGAVRDLDQLAQIAIGLHNDLARQELSVRIDTDDMASWFDPRLPIDPNEEPDLLRLRAGTPIRIMVARANQDPANGPVILTALGDILARTRDNETALRKWLLEQQQRFDPTLDDASTRQIAEQNFERFATAYRADRMTDLFYFRSGIHKFNWHDGWSLVMEAINYLESRSLPRNLTKPAQVIDAEKRIPGRAARTADQNVVRNAAAVAAGIKGTP